MDLYFKWRFLQDMIGLVIFGLIILGIAGILLYAYISGRIEYNRRNKKDKGAGK